MPFRTLLFWTHLAAGVAAGMVILLMSVTGVALTYERQLIRWSDRAFWSSPVEGAARLPVDQLIAGFSRSTDTSPTSVTVMSDPAAPVAMQVERRTFYVSPYSGQLLGEAPTGVRSAMAELRAWHRWLATEGDGRATARAITGWANVAFLFMVFSGIYLWFPRRWSRQSLRAVSVPRWNLAGKARDFNWHNALGIWSAVPLAIVVASAVPISFPWGNALVYRLVGEEPPAQARGRGPAEAGTSPAAPSGRLLQPLLAQAQTQEADWRSIAIRIPAGESAPVVVAIDRGDGGQPQLRSTLTFGPSGDVRAYDTFGDQSAGRQLRSVARFAHTGEVLGITGQTVAGLASAAGVVLVWTGLALALRRAFAWARRRGPVAAAAQQGRAA